MNKDGKGPARGVGRGLGDCGKFRKLLLGWINAIRSPWVWWAFLKGLVIGFLLGWWIL